MLSRKDLRCVLEVRPHFFCDFAHTNRSEVVDGESSVLWIIHREHASEGGFEIGDLEPLHQFRGAEFLHHLLHEDLDEDTG